MTRVFEANKRGLTALVMALALAGGVSSSALAGGPPYTVHIKVHHTVTQGSSFVVTALGESANLSQLHVFIDSRACALTAERERAHPKAKQIIAAKVVGSYTRSRTLTAKVLGRHAVCAYLGSVPPPSPPLLRARASTSYTIVP